MKILYYSPHPNLALNSNSGYGTHMREMIAAFERAGHAVKPLIMGGLDEHFDSSAPHSRMRKMKGRFKQIVPLKVWESLKDLRLIWKDQKFEKVLQTEIKDFEPDLIYERANYLQPSGVRVANKMEIKHVLEVNSPYVVEKVTMTGVSSFFGGLAETIEQELLQQTDRVVVDSSSLQDYFVEKYSISKNKIKLAPMAIDIDKISVGEEQTSEIKQNYNLSGKTVIGFVGSLLPWHGVDLLIKAAKRISKLGIECKFLIVGDGEEATSLKKLRNNYQIQDIVIFTGRVPHSDIFNYIEAMDITIMPATNWWGSPVKIFEYGAMGKPIIAPDAGPIRDVMVHNKDGLLIESEEEKLADAITKLIEDEELRNRIARNFNEKVLRLYTWDQNVEKVLDKIQR